jgi:predicted nucleotidyltransferase
VELDRAIAALRANARLLVSAVPDARWYVFGSAVRDATLPRDLDVLIIYQRDHDADTLRATLEKSWQSLPLHLLLLREDEENELQFVTQQQAVCIFPEARIK